MLKLYFPNIYDVKYLMKSCKSLKGGLQEVSELLEVKAMHCINCIENAVMWTRVKCVSHVLTFHSF